MMRVCKVIFIFFVLFLTFSYANTKNKLLFYVGITMVKPVNELAKNFERRYACEINILQGGSKDLYLSGSLNHRTKNLKDELLLDAKFIGFNKLSLGVKKGNPLKCWKIILYIRDLAL